MDPGFYRGSGETTISNSDNLDTSNGYATRLGGKHDHLASAIFSSGGDQSDLSHDNGPLLYIEPNRTSAIDDIRSVVIYIFIITILFSFFLILPGIRNEKFPTFLCITTSLVVTSIVMIALLGTTWHVAEAPISASYKAFSRDRIQGDLEVRIGLQSVNISLVAQRYYFMHPSGGPVIYENALFAQDERELGSNSTTEHQDRPTKSDENFKRKRTRLTAAAAAAAITTTGKQQQQQQQQQQLDSHQQVHNNKCCVIKRFKMDINYNERFYWIKPDQMRQEYQLALQRGLPYPILTVVEYLSQDDAGFNWSRQYRTAGYYATINLWLSVCLCVLMFCLHCAVPKYGIYAMQSLGCLLLFTNLTYATLVPRGDRALVIPFEGQALRFRFGWNFWLVLVGGCLSLLVGTIIVIIDNLFPSFIFTTVLDADFESQTQGTSMSYQPYHRRMSLIGRDDHPAGQFEKCHKAGSQLESYPAKLRRHRHDNTSESLSGTLDKQKRTKRSGVFSDGA